MIFAMKDSKHLSLTFRFLRYLGFNYSEKEYGNVSICKVLVKIFLNFYHALLQSMMNWVIFEPIAPRMLRPFLLKRMGAKVGKGVFIGDRVVFDLSHSDMIILEDGVSIAGGSRFLCHQRDFSNYFEGSDYNKLGYVVKPIILKKGCLIGMNSFVLPGVTVGEGAIIGAGSLVSKNIPSWTIATGRPARVTKIIPHREY